MSVIKRNGTKVDFDGTKIKAAIKKANNHSVTKQLSPAVIDEIADYIEYKYHKNGDEDITIEQIQDMVEDQIIAHGANEVAKTYIRYRFSRMDKHDLEGIDKEANHKAISKLKIRKKNGTLENYSADKILEAVNKSAARAREDGKLTEEESLTLITLIESDLVKKAGDKFVTTQNLHLLIEKYLEKVAPDVGKAYTNYHSFRMGQAESWEKIMGQCTTLIGNDKDDETMTQKNQNANADSTLSSTQKCFFADYTAEQYYERFFLTKEERQIAKDGYLYWHDKNGRIVYSLNCCLFRMDHVLKNGFQMNGIWYNSPKSLDTAFDVLGDLTLMSASQQYGGFTIPRIDSVLAPYAEMSYEKYKKKYTDLGISEEEADKQAEADIASEMESGFQGLEYKFNTVASSRGDYPFTTVTFGLDTSRWGKMAAKICLKTRQTGQGKKGKKKPVLFPKLVFLYDENLHGEGCINHDVFEAGLECSAHTMYPDWLSLTGEGYVPSMYKKYGVDGVISPMGCTKGDTVINYIFSDKNYPANISDLFDTALDYKHSKINIIEEGVEIWLPEGVAKIYDAKLGDYTEIKRIIRRKPEYNNKWYKITVTSDYNYKEDAKGFNDDALNALGFGKYREVIVTDDHPFEIEDKGVVLTRNLMIGDKILLERFNSFECGVGHISKIEEEDYYGYSYDVTTESEHFTINRIYSHNCRAFLSPYYERGGFEPADDEDKVIYEGRFNLGVISLNLPMILAKAREEDKDFYEVLDYFLNIIRENHKRTYQFIGHMKASKNPVGFCYGGFYGGNLDINDEIAPILKASTMSFGITALNELQRLYNGKSLVEDNEFALEVMKHINDKIAEFKKEDGILYAIYGTPAENLCNKQVRQFRAKYGIIPGVSDREYVSNSFHCHVTENISPIEKQDREEMFWNLFNGGKIQYCRYPVGYNIEAMRTLILRAMKKGFYEGVNLSLCFCDDCGYQAIEMGNKCPKCGGYHITQIDRMNGYLAFTRVGSDTRVEVDEDGNKTIMIHSRYSPHKIKEISERVSM